MLDGSLEFRGIPAVGDLDADSQEVALSLHRPPSGRLATVSIDQVEQVIINTCECDALVAGEHGGEVRALEIQGRQDLESIRSQTASGGGFKLSNDPLFTEKVYDIVGLYLHPPESAVVLSVDEKSQYRHCNGPSRRCR